MFNKFEYFGSIADKETRQKVANSIFETIQKVEHNTIELLDGTTENFSTAINTILANDTLRELCQKDLVLAEKVTLEMLDFINQAKRKVQVTENPHTKESENLNQFSELAENELLAPQEDKDSYLTQFMDYLGSNYPTDEIQTDFYKEMFEKSIESVENEAERVEKQSFDSVKAHLVERWKGLLFVKQTKYELAIIDKDRKKFCEDLYKRIEELKKLQEVLEPFNAMLGRLWDMSKGNWQRVNFDLLKQFAELLKRDKALAELAEMLGRMRQAEIEFETETFTNTIIKTEWKIEHARKEDLIGIYESDDLNNMLPSEAAFLSDPVLETIFYKKFVEKKLQTFEYESKSLNYKEEKFEDKRLKAKQLDKGPFIICVDTSGSMHGTPELVAKTLCFAILKIAIQENRKCYLISFSTNIETLNLSDFKNSMEKLLQFLAMSFHGGTDATPAVRESLKMLQTQDYEKADVLMISDFVMSHFDATTKAQIQAAKAKKTKFHSLVIGSSQNQGVISDFDNTWIYDPNNRNAMITLVEHLSKMRKDSF
jgi:uncharacterized protein with von Willebrand factor type A (vWA) domain